MGPLRRRAASATYRGRRDALTPSPRKTTTEIGRDAEALAERYLAERGLTLVTRNYRCRVGELDLVMRDHETLVFVEVRRRARSHFGGGAVSIDARKQARLIAAAEHYLVSHRLDQRQPCRFDVVAIDGAEAGPEIDWISGAFDT